jgi:hypothetical protein
VVRLTKEQANQQALRLRAEGLSYASIAKVMRVYHGHVAQPTTWYARCRTRGAGPKVPGRGYS